MTRCRIIHLLFWSLLATAGYISMAHGQTDPLLVLSAKNNTTGPVEHGLTSELSSEFAITTFKVNESSTIADISRIFTTVPPRATVLIGEKSIRYYVRFADADTGKTRPVPIVAIFVPDMQREMAGLRNVKAVEEETPMVTALVSFRRVVGLPVETVGVVYRTAYADFIAKHTEYCKREKFTIRGIMIGNNDATIKNDLANALRQLLKNDPVKALWIPNDKALLTPELIRDVWVPLFSGQKIPIIVGDRALVNPELNFATYAVVADPEAMGAQAADLIYDLKNEDWNLHGIEIYPAISTYSVLNFRKAVEIVGRDKIDTSEVEAVVGVGGQ